MEKNNNFCIVSSMEEISSVNLDAYTYLVQRGEMSSLKIWYKNVHNGVVESIFFKVNEGDEVSCIESLCTLICKDGVIGLDYIDAFRYMGGEEGRSIFELFSVHDTNKAKAFCRNAKSCVILIAGDYTILEAMDMLESLGLDDVEVAFQVHVCESENEGKMYIWKCEEL